MLCVLRIALPLLLGFTTTSATAEQGAAKDWSFNATIIEACSCPMFCQCYFQGEPAAPSGHEGHDAHAGHGGSGHYCRFNNAYRVNHGSYGSTKLDGVKFWVAGDLGGDFAKGKAVWAVLTVEPSATKEQREALSTILGHVYPVKWDSFEVKEGAIEWAADKDKAHAALNGGKTAEVTLKRNQGNTDDPIVIKNLKYWGVPRNDGFLLMQNEVEAYREGDRAFEFKGTNGFMITIDVSSKDVAKS
ncbi:MAG: DUF1326 domain-containing protein [Planctomycetota bacterium]